MSKGRNESHRGYLTGPTAEQLYSDAADKLQSYSGRHDEWGAIGQMTPRGSIALALYAAHKATVRYRANGRLRTVTGLVWHIKGNWVEILSPDNRFGSTMYQIDVDTIVSVGVSADDGLVRDRG